MERDLIFKSAASVKAWEDLGEEGQVTLVDKAAKRAAYIARCYGAQLEGNELWSATWTGITDRLSADYLHRYSGITLETVAYRAARAGVEVWRYSLNKHGRNSVPLEDWNGVDIYDTEESMIIRTALQDCFAELDNRGKAVAELIAKGYTERETGKTVGISGPAVHKRVVQMRQRLKAELY